MHDPFKNPTRRELAFAVGLAAAWALVGFALSMLLSTAAHGAAATGGGASCRVFNHLPGGAVNVGSGTLVDVTDDRRSGLVLSCAHLWSEGAGRVVVQFAGGRTHGARVVALDREADLAALEIANPREAPAEISSSMDGAAGLTACGFGPDGTYRCVPGRVLGEVQSPGQVSVKIAGTVRSGDSGGGVFDERGRLVGVVWGESGGVTYASTGGPLRRFLQKVLGRRAPVFDARSSPSAIASGAACPNGRCPLMAPRAIAGADQVAPPPSVAPPSSRDCGCLAALAALGERVERVEALSRERHESLLGRVGQIACKVGTARGVALAASALGISGPAGWAVLAAASVGGLLIGRRLKRRAQKRAPSSQEATAAAGRLFRAAEQHIDQRQPIERDDREARELLRLSQLEGRDPLQDAVAGRLALDRLDEAAESDADPQHAGWADRLRRELRERFNDIAPTKFQVKAES